MPTLNWIGKQAVVKHHKEVPFRLLEPVPELSLPSPAGGRGAGGEGAHAERAHGDTDSPGANRCDSPEGVRRTDAPNNLIVQGDNLHALKALLPRYAGQVKCIYIDPPYNTGNEGWVYNDNVNSPEIRKWLGEVVGKEGETLDRHDRWLCMMYPRLVLLRQYLRNDGVIWVSIDDAAIHLLRALMDEVFGASKFVACNVWQKRYSRENREAIGDVHEYLLIYAMNPAKFKETRNKVPIDEKQAKVYRNPNNDPKGRWRPIPLTAQAGHATKDQFYEITSPSGKKFKPSPGRCWGLAEATFNKLRAEGRIYFGKKGDSQPNVIRYLSEVEGVVPWTWWTHEEVGHTDEATKELMSVLGGISGFDTTPKPSRLIQRLLQIATDKDSLVLDSFAGSGTTAHAVLKQNAEDGGNRRFILVEMDDAIARNVTAERVRRVAQGYTRGQATLPSPVSGRGVGGEGASHDPDEDTLSPALSREWDRGKDWVPGLGGGFQFCRLSAEPLFDADGQIRRDVTFAQLAEFVWFLETGAGSAPSLCPAATDKAEGRWPLLGIHAGRAVYLLYNGILKDRSDLGGNVLNQRTLALLDETAPGFAGPRVVYGARTRFDRKRLAALGITFHQLPYELAVKTWF
ncbi:MAG: site-specific DNA-methyltransferase [Immundisolibacter sp.]|uniref:site-specific DNA-methyltransferase n=1 Tax=Immundisolibacter sp. TaxID=1934948 RepID=UPI003D11CC16